MIHIDIYDYSRALLGGVLIGLAASILLIFSGRIAGVSGILYRSISEKLERAWRWLFLLGLISGGFVSYLIFPDLIQLQDSDSNLVLLIAGLMVGFGAVLGNGCTSGHGVCGISRFSTRSLVATAVFMAFGALMVFLTKHWIGEGF